MDKPLSEVPEARFPSPERQQQDKEDAARRAAAEAHDPSHLPTHTINASFRAFAAGEKIRVHALDVGAGSCILVECPASNEVLMYDCGSLKRTPQDKTRAQARQYVEDIVGNAEPIVVMSHSHIDHTNLIPHVLESIKPRSIWIGGRETDYGSGTDDEGVVADLHDWIQRQTEDGVILHHGFTTGFDNGGEAVHEMQCGDAETFILSVNNEPAVSGDDNRRKHANNLLLLVRYGEFKAVFTGDAVGEAEGAALESYGALIGDSTLLFASHHGARSNDSNSIPWVNAVRPSIVVYSADTRPDYGHPKGEIVDRYRSGGTLKATKNHLIWKDPVASDSEKETTTLAEYVTELNGTVIVESDGASEVTVSCSRASDCW
jgi:beta-lactamase superfamily II metal-dependent hydrolase